MNSPAPSCNVRELWPLLLVRDIGRSVDFYRDVLGFEVVGEAKNEGAPFWRRVQRGGACLMLQQCDDDEAPGLTSVTFYFVCEDAGAMHVELSSRGLDVALPELAYYGMKQIFLTDPDGYSLCFESPTERWSG